MSPTNDGVSKLNEEEVIQHLLRLPRAVREHLIATYRDAAALYEEAMQLTEPQHLLTAIATQQSIYQRIANRLLDSLKQEDPGTT
jgi:hypothetical protein